MSTALRRPKAVTKQLGDAKPSNAFTSLDSLLTVPQWAAMADTKPRYELIAGKLVQRMTTNTAHAWATGEFLFMCKEWGRAAGWTFLPEGTGVRIDEYTAYVPDVVGFAPEFVLDPKANYNERPFLVVEVLSKSTSKKDRTDKLRDYARAGVPLYVIINTATRTVEIYGLQGDAYGAPAVLHENEAWQPAELPGLRLDPARLWI